MASTIKDIAKQTGLGLATISKYLNGGNIREENKVLIDKAVKDLNYTVNEFARGLKSNKSRTIGVLIPELSNVFITTIITKIESILRKKGYSVIICDCHTDRELECKAVDFLITKKVDGIINMPVCSDGAHLKNAIEQNIPIVLIDRIIEGYSDCVNTVFIDNVKAAEDATTYLLQNGHKNIGIIVGPKEVFTSNQRLMGYKNALQNYNVPIKENLITFSDYTVEGGYEGMRNFVENNNDITAVLVTNNEMTIGAIIAINEMNVSIPDKISFIGFDNSELSQVVHPKLTMVTQPLEEIGEQAASIILTHLTNKTAEKVNVKLDTVMSIGKSVKKI